MRFVPNEDQAAFLTVLDQMIEPHRSWHVSPDWSRHDWSTELDGALEASGFYDCAAEESLGLPAAAIMTYRLASLPVLVESAASSMVRALFASDLPRPVAVIDGRVDSITPYLPVARSVIQLGNDGVYSAVLPEGAVKEVESIFAYPMGVLATDGLDWQHVEADSAVIRDAWRVGLAAEMAGCLKGGLDAVVTHVRDRHQFGRPLGSFQSIQHRLAGASVKIEGAYWLALRAAQRLGTAEPALALGYVQESSTQIVYDLHQFMGAMGLTLEHPLHRWTYRTRLMRSFLGGASMNLGEGATARWRAA